MQPARSTTPVGTSRGPQRRPSVPLGLALVAELVVAATLLGQSPVASPLRPTPPAAPLPALAAPTGPVLHLADGRTVRLVGTAPLLTRIAAEIGSAVDAVAGFWGDDWSRDIVIVAADSDAQFAAEAGDPYRQWTGVAAVTVADAFDPSRRTVTGQRIVFAEGANAMSEASLRTVLRHELFHYASRADTTADAPQWLTEGVADYVGRPATPVTRAATPAALPSDADLDAQGAQRSAAYDRAWLFARYVADSYSAPALRRLYLLACGPGHPDPTTAVSVALGTPLPDLLSRWQRWLGG